MLGGYLKSIGLIGMQYEFYFDIEGFEWFCSVDLYLVVQNRRVLICSLRKVSCGKLVWSEEFLLDYVQRFYKF